MTKAKGKRQKATVPDLARFVRELRKENGKFRFNLTFHGEGWHETDVREVVAEHKRALSAILSRRSKEVRRYLRERAR